MPSYGFCEFLFQGASFTLGSCFCVVAPVNELCLYLTQLLLTDENNFDFRFSSVLHILDFDDSKVKGRPVKSSAFQPSKL